MLAGVVIDVGAAAALCAWSGAGVAIARPLEFLISSRAVVALATVPCLSSLPAASALSRAVAATAPASACAA